MTTVFRNHRTTLATLLIGVSFALTGCSDDDSSAGGSTSTTISGTAATGLAMAGATIEVRCNGGVTRTGITTNASGGWSTTVPTASLPCVIRAQDDSNTWYSFTTGTGSSIVANVTPLSTLALADLLGADPDTLFAALGDANLAGLSSTNINAALAALNTALAGYALPADFNAITTLLVAATEGQDGNHYDDLLEQLLNALGATSFDTLLTGAASGTYPVLPTPAYTPGATSMEDFLATFAGDYTLQVTTSGGEGSSGSTAAALFPEGSARVVHIHANGDVSIDAVGRTVTYAASDYNRDFIGTGSTENQLRYRTNDANNWLELYITYDPATGTLRVQPSGFVNDEGYAWLEARIYVPADEPETPVETCTSGDDKLVFTNAPADFCGFTRSASANSIDHYFQFTSAAGTHGVTYVKFNLNNDDSAVESMVIENDDYAFGCGGALPACNGVTITSGSTWKQFALANTTFTAISGATNPMTVSGLLIHPVASSGGGDGDEETTLARKLSAPFAGTYTLSCYSNGSSSPLVTRTVVVNADGSSTLDGNAVMAEGHGGNIRYHRGSSDTYEYGATFVDPSTYQETSFRLKFMSDGALVTDTNRSHTAYINGQGGTCTGTAGPAVGSNPISKAGLPTLVGSYALTDTLTCSGASAPLPNGSTEVAIDSDGTLRAGTFSLSPAQYTAAGSAFTIQDGLTFPGTSILTPAVIGFTVGGEVPVEGGGTLTGGFFFRLDGTGNATQVRPELNPSVANCTP